MRLYLMILFALFVVGCANVEPENDASNVGARCNQDSDCVTPVDYLIQSNCPFTSVCIESNCKVACPMDSAKTAAVMEWPYYVPCNSTSDCDCSWRGNRTIECVCFENSCLSIEAE